MNWLRNFLKGLHPPAKPTSEAKKSEAGKKRQEIDWNKELDRIAKLEDGWDSYDARKISNKAINTAHSFLRNQRYCPTHVAPQSDGGLQIEWYTKSLEVEIEIDNEGNMDVILITPKMKINPDWYKEEDVVEIRI